MSMNPTDAALAALDLFEIEIPSWGFANTGTRFGKFIQSGAATTTAEKIADAGQVHAVTGCCPSLAMHVLWDFPRGIDDVPGATEQASTYGIRIGSINPNLFQDQIYKHGSLGSHDPLVRQAAIQHIVDSIEIAKITGSQDISLWFADGSNFPGTTNIRQRKRWFTEGLVTAHASLAKNQRLLVEYKPFEPAFYHTDIADWGMATMFALAAGPQAKVLVDTGHHYQAQNIEQIVAWLLDENMLGGFHFNDRRYADDDLTIGSIDPYQVFRIFFEIHFHHWEHGSSPQIAYMIDQSHNLKPKIEEMIQTVCTAQELYLKAALVDFEQLVKHQQAANLIDAEECLKRAFFTDVSQLLSDWRKSRRLEADPLKAYRLSGYQQKIEKERHERNSAGGGSYA